jgi:hypothetical protein
VTELVPVTRTQKIVLRDAPIKTVAEELLGSIPQEAAPEDFPELPGALTASKEIRDALKTLSASFNKTIVTERRTLSEDEVGAIGAEYTALQQVLKLIGEREEQIKEIVRTHQDVDAEEKGLAFARDQRLNGNLVAKATERDAKGHYVLAAKGAPNRTPIPGSTMAFSNEFSSGRVTEDLGAIDRAYAAGDMDEKTYRALTVTRRVPDPEKIRAYVLRTGDTGLLAKIVKRGRNRSALYLRALKK